MVLGLPIGGSLDEQAGTFLHELGHNLGLGHGGSDDTNCKVNYLSVMGYLFQFANFVSSRPLDYSQSALAPLDKNNLNEPAGISQSHSTRIGDYLWTSWKRTGASIATAAGVPVDWNFNGRTTDTGVPNPTSMQESSMTEIRQLVDFLALVQY